MILIRFVSEEIEIMSVESILTNMKNFTSSNVHGVFALPVSNKGKCEYLFVSYNKTHLK